MASKASPARLSLPFGLWPSPVSPALLGGRLRLEDVQWDSDGRGLVWLEGRPEGGVLVSLKEGDAFQELTAGQGVRAGVGYGGGDFSVSQGTVFFVEESGRLYRRELRPGQSRPITPAFGRAAAPRLSPDGRWVVYVHTYEGADSLGLAAADGQGWPAQLAQGADFYMQPAWSPDGSSLAWVEWDHPNMPWDGTRLMLAGFDAAARALAGRREIAGGPDVPIFQPEFSPDGRWLSYIAGQGEWDSLVLYDLSNGQKRALVEGGSLSRPAWIQGMRVYGWSPSSQTLYFLRNEDGFSSLSRVEVESGRQTLLDLGPYAWVGQLAVSPIRERLALTVSAPNLPTRLVTWENGRTSLLRRSEAELLAPEDLPVAQPISWLGPEGTPVHGLYFAPASSRYQGEGLPPAIVYIHGGPTDQTTAAYSSDAAFFTSRGYAYLAVNYRGSSGYGRSYQRALRERWGLVDREDAAGGARALADQGLADPKRLVIKGGSAGGMTVLNALIHYPGLFKAGICSYGVSDLFGLALETHKFEAHYTDSLVGRLPEAAARYREGSPIYSAGEIQDPLAIFQGDADNVVPPRQAEEIVAALRARRVPHVYRLYEGEGHGWRKSETIVDFYTQIERFLKEYVLFSA